MRIVVILGTLLLLGAGLAWWLMSADLDTAVVSPETVPVDVSPLESESLPPASEPAATLSDTGSVDDCLTDEAFNAHPLVRAEMGRVAAVLGDSAELDNFLGLDEATVRSMADQGDATAMAVMGAIQMVRSEGRPDEYAVSYLQEAIGSRGAGSPVVVTPEVKAQVETAQAWFYQSAAYGRLNSLLRYADLFRYTTNDATEQSDLPVTLGWIAREEYDALSDEEREALHPAHVYTQLVVDIAPNLATGPIYNESIAEIPVSGRQVALRLALMNQFQGRVAEQGQTVVDAPPADEEALYELAARRCED